MNLREIRPASSLVALLALVWACSSTSGNAGNAADGGAAPSDASSGPGASSDGGAGDGDGGGSASTKPHDGCYADAPFTATAWAPPTPMHQNKCSPAEVSAFIATVESGQLPLTSGNAACDACLQTDVAAPKHGPVVTAVKNGVETTLVNFGGCVASADTNTAAGSCGDQYNGYQECVAAECSDCADFAVHGPLDLACIKQATAAGSRCQLAVPHPSCLDELQGDGGASACLNGVAMMNAWCGP